MTEAELQMALDSMSQGEAVGLGAVVGLGIGVYIIMALAIWVFRIIVQWRIFSKAGEPGWKSIIPFYNDYTLYKFTWNTKFFWITYILAFAGSIFNGVLGAMNSVGNIGAAAIIVSLIVIFISIVLVVLVITQTHKLSKSFGHGVGFTVGLLLLAPIFQIILAFGSSEYKGADL